MNTIKITNTETYEDKSIFTIFSAIKSIYTVTTQGKYSKYIHKH